MRRLNGLLVCLVVLSLLVSVNLSAAQGGIPLPANAADAYMLFPGVVQDGMLAEDSLQQQYVLLANAGNVMSVTATMAEPGLLARLELVDEGGVLLAEQAADPAAPDTIVLNYEVTADGWYFVNVTLAAAPTATSAYTLALTGTTSAVFDVLEAGDPPTVPNAHLMVATGQVQGMLEAAPVPFLIPVAVGDTIEASAEGASAPRFRVTQFDDGQPGQTLIAEAPQAGAAVTYTYTSDADRWLRIDVEPGQPGPFTFALTHPRASAMAADVVTEGGVDADGAGVSGELCGGIPARFAVGDVLIVSPEGDNLQLLTDYVSGSGQTLDLALTGDLLEVLEPPVCYTSPGYNQDIWFWYVYSQTDEVNGWVADGLADERWVCAQRDPACNQTAECATEPSAFAVGDMVVVSQTGDNLQIVRYPGASDQVLDLAVWNDQLEIVSEPSCYYSAWHGGGLWYWEVYSESDEINGWVIEGVDDEIWLCPITDPTCDQ